MSAEARGGFFVRDGTEAVDADEVAGSARGSDGAAPIDVVLHGVPERVDGVAVA